MNGNPYDYSNEFTAALVFVHESLILSFLCYDCHNYDGILHLNKLKHDQQNEILWLLIHHRFDFELMKESVLFTIVDILSYQ